MALDGWIAYYKPRAAPRVRLFCFPFSGGGASTYRTWQAELPAAIEVCPVQLPGRESRLREPPYTRLLPLVRVMAEVLHPLLDLPFAFFGHSLGGRLGFELAREVRRRYGLSPMHLFVSAAPAPQVAFPKVHVHSESDATIVERMRRLGGTPDSVLQHRELMEMLLPLMRADFALSETYVYEPDAPLQCPVSAFGGTADPEVSREGLQAWQSQTCGPASVRIYPGGHFFLHDFRAEVLEAIAAALAASVERSAVK
ncbi:MAG TPA: alpha/beta fold hydrolase [Symbiobacteriaceae bacterium]|nr:alpha/beta fold hydrolase [Symbiobacteriaceae bacterium]